MRCGDVGGMGKRGKIFLPRLERMEGSILSGMYCLAGMADSGGGSMQIAGGAGTCVMNGCKTSQLPWFQGYVEVCTDFAAHQDENMGKDVAGVGREPFHWQGVMLMTPEEGG